LWLAKAQEDLQAGELILAGSMRSFGAVSFHAQQAAEKAVKALLIRQQIEFGRTHNLGELLRLAEPAAPGISQQLGEAVALTPHAVDTRYPTEGAPVSREEASRHIDVARQVRERVTAVLKSYLDAGRPGP
jgi:HEPN domain-containing protein